MKKHVFLVCALVCMLFTGLAGCGEKGSKGPGDGPVGTGSATTPAVERNAVPAQTSYVTDEMYENALKFANVNLSRLKAVMKKAEARKPVTVAVIGGSITQGSSATKPENSYASIMKKWWQETFPETTINYVNAGIGGTDSYLGVHRMGPDLLDYNPDFVIVEFSVNDANNSFYKTTYENLVRRVILQDNSPAVLLLYMTQDDGTSAQNNHVYTGFNYKLPQISYHDMILKELEAERIKWTEISPDNIHPNDKGHAICGEVIWRYLNSVYEALDEPDEPLDLTAIKPLSPEVYMNGGIFDNTSISADKAEGFAPGGVAWGEFGKGWQAKAGGSITFTVKAKRIGILFDRSVSGTYGTATVTVDGKEVGTLEGDFTGGWGNSVYAKEIFAEKDEAVHTVTVTVPEGKWFDILGILVSKDKETAGEQ